MKQSVFRSAITGPDGGVDAGYLAAYWALIGWSVNNVVLLAVALIAVDHGNAPQVIQNTGVALGANAGGFAAVLGAVGLFRMGDKPRAGTVETSSTSKEVTKVS